MNRRHKKSRAAHGIEPLESRLLMAVWSVLNNNDAGPGSLRAAIAAAAPMGDTIDLTGRAGTITLGVDELTIDKSLQILGPGEAKLKITSDMGGLFYVAPGATLTMSDVTLHGGYSNGDGGGGGGILSLGTLSLTRVTFSDCTAYDRGGAIFHSNGGALTLTNCSFVGNTSEFSTNTAAWGGAVVAAGGSATISG